MATAYSPRSQCEGKVPYQTKRHAKAAVKRSEARFGDRMQAYRCAWCSAFHIGHRVHPANRRGGTSTAPANVKAPGDVASVPGADRTERR